MGIHWIEEGVSPEGNLKIYRNGVLWVEITNGGTVIIYNDETVYNDIRVVNGNIVVQTGDVEVAGKFGCNGASPQAAYLLPDNATDDLSCQNLANAIKEALIACGICK